MPRAADSPTRRPVKLPGPVVTAMRSRPAKPMPDCLMTRAISGISASACPRFIGSDSRAISLPAWVTSTAAAQASSAVSMARISMTYSRHARACPGHPRLSSLPQDKTWMAGASPAMTKILKITYQRKRMPLNRPHLDHVRHEMLEQVLDAVLQRRCRRRAAGAGTLHVQIDDAVLEAAERDVAAVIGHRRANARLDQILDGFHGFAVGFVEKLALRVRRLV